MTKCLKFLLIFFDTVNLVSKNKRQLSKLPSNNYSGKHSAPHKQILETKNLQLKWKKVHKMCNISGHHSNYQLIIHFK